jgi:hypothetical protein
MPDLAGGSLRCVRMKDVVDLAGTFEFARCGAERQPVPCPVRAR